MPVPLRNSGQPGPTRRLIVFVHGFGSDERTWDPLRAKLEGDSRIHEIFDLRFFGYQTGLAGAPLVRRLPTIDEAGAMLAAYLDTHLVNAEHEDRYIDATLVGHSMGGLVIQAFLAQRLTDGAGRELDRLRQVILFATPNFGAQIVSGLRKVLAHVVANPQEEALRLFSPQTSRLLDVIRDHVIFAKRRERDEYPLPFCCFWGTADNIVVKESALGHFPSGEPLKGDHFTIHALHDPNEYNRFVAVLLHPHGHPNVWEVDTFTFSVKVSPAPPKSEVMACHGTKQRLVRFDNVAKVTRQAVFSKHNHCRDPFVLKYGTRNDGWVVPEMSEPHITPKDKVRLYEDNGVDAYFEVDPRSQPTATLKLTVYKGFDAGHRDYHMHLGRSTYFRRIRFIVDLTDYHSAGWTLTPPLLYFHPVDPGDHLLCLKRQAPDLDPDPAHTVDPAGIWTWDLEFIKEGVVDIAWDVEAPPASNDAADTITLAPGEHALVGYGSHARLAEPTQDHSSSSSSTDGTARGTSRCRTRRSCSVKGTRGSLLNRSSI
jgi:pimeloyl-ACP methyl ester carboxylesterase